MSTSTNIQPETKSAGSKRHYHKKKTPSSATMSTTIDSSKSSAKESIPAKEDSKIALSATAQEFIPSAPSAPQLIVSSVSSTKSNRSKSSKVKPIKQPIIKAAYNCCICMGENISYCSVGSCNHSICAVCSL